MDVDQRMRFDPPDQVLRHRLAEAVAADEHGDAGRRVREVEDGLTRRVARADDHDALPGALRRLATTGSVVDAPAKEAADAGKVEPPPLQARRGEHHRGGYLGIVVDDQDYMLVVG